MSRYHLAAACLCFLGVGVCRATVAAEYTPPPFDHYQPILDRMPFGSLPPNFGQPEPNPDDAKNAAEVAKAQENLAKQVNMSAINVTPDKKTAVGFTDLSVKPPKNYFLVVGDSSDGWTVKSADYDEEVAMIEKDGVAITLKLGKGLVEPAAKPAAAPPAVVTASGVPPPGARPAGLPPAGVRPAGLPPAPPPAAAGVDARSYIERRNERLAQQAQEQAREHQVAAKKQREQFINLARKVAQEQIDQARAAADPLAPDGQEPPPEGIIPAAPDGNVQ